MNKWKPSTFGEAVECSPKVIIKKGEFVENCEMADIEPSYRFLYPREGKLYQGSNSKFQNGDTVFARITPCLENGKIAQIKSLKTNKGIGSTEFFVFRGKKDVSDTDFVFYLCRTNLVIDTAVNSMTGASGRQRADLKAVKKVPVNLPPLAVQQQIATTLSAYDELIEVNLRRIALLEETARELYKEWFVRMRFPGYRKAKFVKGIPKEWEICKVGQLLELVYGKALKEESRNDGPYQVYGSSGVIGHHSTFIAKAPGIVVGRKGNVGSVFWVTKDFYPIDTAFFVKTKISLYYIFFNLQGQHFIEADAAVPGLNRNQAYANFILKPDEDILKRFDEVVKPLFELKANLENQIIQLRQIRDRLLPRLISGKLEVKASTTAAKVIEMQPTQPVSMVAEEDEGYVKTKKTNLFFQRRVLAAYIIDRLKNEPTFGHVKLMKLMYLCEHLAEIETASNYHRDAAGPYDNKMIRSIDSQLKSAQWFECKQIDKKYTYTPLAKKNEYKAWFTKYYSDKEAGIESLLQIFGKEKTELAEMVATLYEAHRDLKERKQIPSDNAVINEVLNNWHDSKKRIEESRWLKCLERMKARGWIK